MGKAQSSQGIKRTPTKVLLLPIYRIKPENASGLKRWRAYMHQNLLNAGFAFVDYLSDKNENVQAIWVIKPLTKVLHKSFFCTYACHELHFPGEKLREEFPLHMVC